MSELAKVPNASTQLISRFAGFTDQMEGETERSGVRGIVKYNEPMWLHLGVELPRDDEYIIHGVDRYAIMWHADDKHRAPDREFIPPGTKFPDLNERNKQTPREQWVTYPDGSPKPPWEKEYQVLMINAKYDRFTFVTATIGGGIAVRELVSKVEDMQSDCNNSFACPVVLLRHTHMNSQHNKKGLERPYFEFTGRWVIYGDGGALRPLPPRPSLAQVTGDKVPY
jgi:hypothetical protein